MKPDTAAAAAARVAADGEPRRRGAAAAVGRAGAQTSPSTTAFTPNAATPTRSDSSARFGARQGQR